MGTSIYTAMQAAKRAGAACAVGFFFIVSWSAFTLDAHAQETAEEIKAKHEAYFDCINNIETKPRVAYIKCSDYLKRYPNDDQRLVEFARMFTTAFEKIDAYLRSVPASDFIDGAKWSIYKPDLQKVIPWAADAKDKHKIEINRTYATPDEDRLLARAEAVYGPRRGFEDNLFKQWRFYSQGAAELPNSVPAWWSGRFDTVLSTQTVTTSAVLYYYELSLQLRANDDRVKPDSFQFSSTELKYTASIEPVATYTRSGKTFKNVYIAEMILTWGQVCGLLCGYGFTRNKVVALSANGEILDVFLDDPVNSSSWVS